MPIIVGEGLSAYRYPTTPDLLSLGTLWSWSTCSPQYRGFEPLKSDVAFEGIFVYCFSLFLKIIIISITNFMCMGVCLHILLACMSMHHMHTWYLWNAGPKTEVRDACKPPCVFWEPNLGPLKCF